MDVESEEGSVAVDCVVWWMHNGARSTKSAVHSVEDTAGSVQVREWCTGNGAQEGRRMEDENGI
jgi:hypothetical protein